MNKNDTKAGHLEYIKKKQDETISEFEQVMKGTGIFRDLEKIRELRNEQQRKI